MELKQWMGLVGAGCAVLVLAFAVNDPEDIFAREGISAPRLDGVALPGAPAPAGVSLDDVTNEIPELPAPRPRPTPPAATPVAKPVTAAPEQRPAKTEPPAAGPAEQPTKNAPIPVATLKVEGAEGRFIRGVVNYVGKSKKRRLIDMSADGTCVATVAGKKVYREDYMIKDGKLANAVVYVDNPPKKAWPVPAKVIHVDQEGCRYTPHVVALMIGQKVKIKNSDPTSHNVHWVSKKNGEWNRSQPTQGESMDPLQPIKRKEIGTASFKCDVHPWMEAKTFVFDHPFFAITKEDGTFAIDCTGLPDGEYVVMAYHEKMKTKYKEGDRKGRIKVKLGADGADLTINYTGKKKKKKKK